MTCPKVMPCQGKRAKTESGGVQAAKRLNSSVCPTRRQLPPKASRVAPRSKPTNEHGAAHSRRQDWANWDEKYRMAWVAAGTARNALCAQRSQACLSRMHKPCAYKVPASDDGFRAPCMNHRMQGSGIQARSKVSNEEKWRSFKSGRQEPLMRKAKA